MPTRRDFLIGAASLATAALAEKKLSAQSRAGQAWDSGEVVHLLPAASHERFLIKTSFRGPQGAPPVLLAGSRKISGRGTDTLGFFWTFDVTRLEPGRPHTLQIFDARGRSLCDPWQLSTLPSPGDSPKSVRLLIYSCAGGHDALPDHKPTDVSTHRFLTLAVRRRMLERAMSFAPDAVVANGDHIYWDLRTVRADLLGASPSARAHVGVFNRAERALGTANEQVLKKAVGPQIAELYGTMMRSTPVFFLQDDHDYFENDEADDKLVTFPPDPFMLALARASQLLYYP
jgi:hypothetical protein